MNFQSYDLQAAIERTAGADWHDHDLNHLIDSLPPLNLSGPWLAGGALRRSVMGQPLESDADIFFKDQLQLDAFIAAFGKEPSRKRDGLTEFDHVYGERGQKIKVQCVHHDFYDCKEDVIDSFDFTLCQLITDGRLLTAGEYTLWDIGRKRLAVHEITYPVASMRRILKYTRQGFTACNGFMAEFLTEVSKQPSRIDSVTAYID